MRETMEKKERNSNLELLRIICMVLIVASHYGSHGGLVDLPLSANHILGLFLKSGGKIGVICFVLITCYFMCEQRFKMATLLRTVLETTFYSLLLFLICRIFGLNVGVGTAIKSLLAVFYGGYWFVPAYIGLYLVQPILKVCSDNLKRNGLLKVIFVLFMTMSFVPFIFGNPSFITSNFAYFCFIYFMGCYIRRYGINFTETKVLSAGLSAWLLIPVFCLAVEILSVKIAGMDSPLDVSYMVYELNSPLMLLAAICLFLCFNRLPKFQNRFINFWGSITFAVYLLHDNLFFKEYMWKHLLNTELFLNKNICLIFLHCICCVIAIFFVTAAIEFVRKKIEYSIFNIRFVVSFCSKVDSWYDIQ